MTVKFLAIILSVGILLFVIELVREEKLTFKYAFGWMVACVLALFFTVFDQILSDVSRFFGFELPSNFLFFGIIGALVFLSLLMTIFLCQQDDRNDIMAQRIGILEFEIEQLKKRKEEDGKASTSE